MSSEQQRKNQGGGIDQAQIMPESTAPITSENTAQKIPEGTAQTRASAEAAGSPDGRNDGKDRNDMNSKDSKNDKNDGNVKNGRKRGKLIGLIAAAAVLIAAVVGIGIYNAPSNRMSRYLDLGARYLEEQNYEQAVIAFNKAIEIDDRCMEAYAGDIKAYQGMGDVENLAAFYEKALDVADALDEETLQAQKEDVAAIYLAAVDVYPDDAVKALEILERGYERTQDGRLLDKINELTVPAEEAAEEPSEESAVEVSVEQVLQLDLNEYDGFRQAANGVILVSKDGKVGAINLNGEIIIPIEYDYWNSIDNNGNCVLIKETTPWTYALFDAEGNLIKESNNQTIVSNGIYIEKILDSSIDYHRMDGSLLVSLPYSESTDHHDEELELAESGVEEVEWPDDWVLGIHGFFDGYSLTDRLAGRVGSVDGEGGVNWSDVKDWSVKRTSLSKSDNGIISAAMGSNPGYTPMNSANYGYFLAMQYDEWGTDMALIDADSYDVVSEFNLYLVQPDAESGFLPEFENETDFKDSNNYRGFRYDGDVYYNYGSEMVWIMDDRDVLVDLALAPGMTVDTMSNGIVKAVYNGIYMSNERYWLVNDGDQWGYIDHDGKEMALFDDATHYCRGRAFVVEEGTAYLIDEQFEKVQELGAADAIYQLGDLLAIENGGTVTFYK